VEREGGLGQTPAHLRRRRRAADPRRARGGTRGGFDRSTHDAPL